MKIDTTSLHYRIYDRVETAWGRLYDSSRAHSYEPAYKRPPLNLCPYLRAILLKPFGILIWKLSKLKGFWPAIIIGTALSMGLGLLTTITLDVHQQMKVPIPQAAAFTVGGIIAGIAAVVFFLFCTLLVFDREAPRRKETRLQKGLTYLCKFLGLPGAAAFCAIAAAAMALFYTAAGLYYAIRWVIRLFRKPGDAAKAKRSTSFLRLLVQWISDWHHNSICRPLEPV